MKIGYPCINWSIKERPNKTFRLSSLTKTRFMETVSSNLRALMATLKWNSSKNLLFFRISSETIPFASHKNNSFNWRSLFHSDLESIGDFIIKNDFRISMHPDQFVLINSPSQEIFEKSIEDLIYHADLLDLMNLPTSAKIQIHVGGVYGDKKKAISVFCTRFSKLPQKIKSRLVIENDDQLYSLSDCLEIHEKTKIPILFDSFHHSLLNSKEPLPSAIDLSSKTWKKSDGILMLDYSSQQKNARKGKHAETLDSSDFTSFLNNSSRFNFDCMLEIKDKEKSALKALDLIHLSK